VALKDRMVGSAIRLARALQTRLGESPRRWETWAWPGWWDVGALLCSHSFARVFGRRL